MNLSNKTRKPVKEGVIMSVVPLERNIAISCFQKNERIQLITA